MGVRRNSVLPQWKPWKLWTSILTDLVSIVASIVTLYEACTLPKADVRRHLGVDLWAYPSLPVALIGLCLLLGQQFFLPRHKGGWLFLLLVVTVLTVVELTVSLILWKFDADDFFGTWEILIGFYFAMTLPFVYCHPILVLIGCLAGWFGRVGGIGFAALSHYADGEPYCKIPGKGFGVTYLTSRTIAAAFSFVGVYYHYPR
jgi:hypothetical protein